MVENRAWKSLLLRWLEWLTEYQMAHGNHLFNAPVARFSITIFSINSGNKRRSVCARLVNASYIQQQHLKLGSSDNSEGRISLDSSATDGLSPHLVIYLLVTEISARFLCTNDHLFPPEEYNDDFELTTASLVGTR